MQTLQLQCTASQGYKPYPCLVEHSKFVIAYLLFCKTTFQSLLLYKQLHSSEMLTSPMLLQPDSVTTRNHLHVHNLNVMYMGVSGTV